MYKETMATVTPAPTAPVGLSAVLPKLTAELPQMIDEVVSLVSDDWPDYAKFVAEDPEDSLRIAEIALLRLVKIAERLPEDPRTAPSRESLAEHEAFEEVGRLEWREGRSLASLMSAYRAGARVAWRHISQAGVELGLDPAAIASLAEAVFIFMEELSSASAHGYVDEQRATSAERERLRAHLAELLLSDRSDSTLVHAMALRAGWLVPTTAALVLIDASNEAAHAALDRLDPQCLPVRHGGLSGGILPDPDAPGRRAVIGRTLRGFGAVVGTTVPPSQLPSSVRVAEAGARLASAGVLTGDPVFVADHYDTIVVVRDPWLLEQLRAQALAPLADVPPITRRRLEDTLGAWLTAMGNQQATARALHVHPQTVRYRLGQLRAHFGPALDDPDNQRRLMLAVCWDRPAS
jgi:PucR C-terminal helix-turn-helix domain